jgi:ASC-1-like (ASCH) protein
MTKTHKLLIREVDRKVFEAIKNKTKTIETRAATDKHCQIKEGDVLEFVCGEDILQKKVKSVKIFKAIEEMANEIEIKKIMPFVENIEEMKKVYYSFPRYEEKINKFGLIVFELE